MYTNRQEQLSWLLDGYIIIPAGLYLENRSLFQDLKSIYKLVDDGDTVALKDVGLNLPVGSANRQQLMNTFFAMVLPIPKSRRPEDFKFGFEISEEDYFKNKDKYIVMATRAQITDGKKTLNVTFWDEPPINPSRLINVTIFVRRKDDLRRI